MQAINFGSLLLGLYLKLLSFVVSGSEPRTQAAFDNKLAKVDLDGTGLLLSSELSAFIDDNLARWNIPGLTIAVVQDGKVELGAWGNMTESGNKMTTDTLFYIASCSKAFLGVAMGILMDDFSHGRNVTSLPSTLEKFNWNTKVKDLLPGEWELMDKWASEKANIRDILSHVSGMPRHDFSYSPNDDLSDIISRMKYLPPAYELRQQYLYNNQMYMVGSYIISIYSGKPYTSFVQQRIFEPLNMTSTTFSLNEALKSEKMTQSWIHSGRRIPHWLPDEVLQMNAGPGGVISNAHDMAAWIQILLGAGVDVQSNRSIIPKAAWNEVTTAHVIVEGKPSDPDLSITGYGIGWERYSYRGHEILSHSGGIFGVSTRVTFLPSEKKGLAILVNANHKAPAITAISEWIFNKYLGQPKNVSVPVIPEEVSSAPLRELTHTRYESRSQLPLPLHHYSGTYANAGYGTPTICDPSSESAYCKEVLSDFEEFSPNLPPLDHQNKAGMAGDLRLFAKWPRMWSSHIRLVHLKGNRFIVQPTTLFPRGYGADTSPFETFQAGDSGMVEFVIKDGRVTGFSLIQTLDDFTLNADAWFSRV